MQVLFGTRMAANINLVAQILILIGLLVGFYFARTRQIPKHRNTQTTMVLVNLVFIGFVMLTSFYNYVISGGTTGGIVARLMIIHGILGLIAEGSGIYLILRMRTQLIPQRLRVRNFKLLMRVTLTLWTAIVVLGFGVYYYRYLAPRATTVSAAAPLGPLRQAGADTVVHALELQEALGRGNLETAKRHAEHVINLIEGKTGKHYGDVDKDGAIEDPGDGTGLLRYVQTVGGLGGPDLEILTRNLRDWLKTVDEDAVTVSTVKDLSAAVKLSERIVSLTQKANTEGVVRLETRARELGMASSATPSPPAPAPSSQPDTLAVVLDQFQFNDRIVTVKKGRSVVWTSREAPKHTVTADDGKFKSGTMSLGDTFTFTFNEAGNFPYYCRFHGDKGGVDMAGTVIVQ